MCCLGSADVQDGCTSFSSTDFRYDKMSCMGPLVATGTSANEHAAARKSGSVSECDCIWLRRVSRARVIIGGPTGLARHQPESEASLDSIYRCHSWCLLPTFSRDTSLPSTRLSMCLIDASATRAISNATPRLPHFCANPGMNPGLSALPFSNRSRSNRPTAVASAHLISSHRIGRHRASLSSIPVAGRPSRGLQSRPFALRQHPTLHAETVDARMLYATLPCP